MVADKVRSEREEGGGQRIKADKRIGGRVEIWSGKEFGTRKIRKGATKNVAVRTPRRKPRKERCARKRRGRNEMECG